MENVTCLCEVLFCQREHIAKGVRGATCDVSVAQAVVVESYCVINSGDILLDEGQHN